MKFTELQTELHTYMATLLEAGFDAQSILEKGYTAAWSNTNWVNEPPMVGRQAAADMVRDAAKALKIDHAAQVESYNAQFKSGSTKDVPFNEGVTA